MKKKIIISIISVIFIISLFTLNSFAYEIGDVIPAGTIITFKNSLSDTTNVATDNNEIVFSCNGINYNRIEKTNFPKLYYRGDTTLEAYSSSGWVSDDYKSITLIDDMTVNSNTLIVLNSLAQNVEPPPPDPIESAYDGADNLIENTFDNIGAILTFTTSNTVVTIITIGILVISLAVGLISRFLRLKKR